MPLTAPITAEFLRSFDWAKTALGPLDSWPKSLKAFVALVLELPTPAIIFWGPDHTQIYNDGYAQIMGPRHPRYFGSTYQACWPDTYPLLAPMMRQVLDGGQYLEVGAAPIMLGRHGFVEEAFFRFTFSPLRDDEGKIAGVYQPVFEITQDVLRQRRAETLRLLSTRRESLDQAMDAFHANAADVPFACVYVAGTAEGALELAASCGLADADAIAIAEARFSAAVRTTLATNVARTVSLEAAEAMTVGPWPEPVREVFLVPLGRPHADRAIGVLVVGAGARLCFDDGYRAFFEAVAREIGGTLAAQRALQLEREWHEREELARREAELAKEENVRRLASLFEHAPVGIAVLRGPRHVFEVANPQLSLLVDERPLLHLPLAVAFPELVGHGLFELIDHVYRSGEPFLGRSIPFTLVGPTGAAVERYFDFACEPIPHQDGRTDGIMVVAFDVTELSRARRDAEAASRAKDEFFAILGHELRNPLAPIRTALQLMRLRGDDTLERERTIIERQVDQITRLVDDLLDVSRITRGKVELKREPVELAAIVASGVEMASPLLERHGHHLVLDVPPAGLVLDGDAARLAQVVSNLLTNAAKYTPPGGTITVAAEHPGTDRVALRVVDTGVGIASDMLPRVFDAFAQEQQSLERAQGGLGLGLAIVKNLVDLHGGSVAAFSAGRGRGSTFLVELPLSTGVPTPAPGNIVSTPVALPSAPWRVLVVDDNEDAAELLAAALTRVGYETRVAHDGAEALRLVAEAPVDVGLLDIGLPVMDGYELASRLRQGAEGQALRLVAVTGYGQDADRLRAKDAGFDAHLVKPVSIDVVIDLLDAFRAASVAGLSDGPGRAERAGAVAAGRRCGHKRAMRFLVTGANRGIGLELVRQLLVRGDSVDAAAREPSSAHELRALEAPSGGRLRLFACDVGADESVAELARAVGDVALDVVINNAGIMGKMQSFEDLDLDDVRHTFDVNALGPIRVTRALLPQLGRGQGKRVVQISSGMGSIADNGSGGAYAYRMSKAALNMANRSLARDFAARGFCCVVMNPGWVQTDMGGSGAPTPVADSVRGILAKIDALTPADTGRFLDFKGADFPY